MEMEAAKYFKNSLVAVKKGPSINDVTFGEGRFSLKVTKSDLGSGGIMCTLPLARVANDLACTELQAFTPGLKENFL